jgi:hypothetical protein
MKKLPAYLSSRSDPNWEEYQFSYWIDETAGRVDRNKSCEEMAQETRIAEDQRAKEILRSAKSIFAGIREPTEPSYEQSAAPRFLATVSENAENVARKVLKKYGIEAFAPRATSESIKKWPPEAELLDAFAELIGAWQAQIETGTDRQARAAKASLQKLFKVLIPARPKRRDVQKNLVTREDISEFYHGQMFTLRHVEHAMRSGGPRNQSTKVKSISEKFGIRIDEIRDFLGLDEDDQPVRSRFTCKNMARKLTAKHFKISLSTVSNLI